MQLNGEPWPAAGRPAAAHEAITALIVDDDRHVRSYLRMLLRTLGVTTVWEAEDAAQAMALYGQHRPTVVLLDENLPTTAGEPTLRRLLALDAGAAVIVVTSRDGFATGQCDAQRGAIGHVLIHVVREQVAQMIAASLARLRNAGRVAAADRVA